jgi:uncharacterized cupin superfamily protein
VTDAHWDAAPRELWEEGPLGGYWTDLGSAAGSVTVGVNRVEILPGKRSTPVHSEGAAGSARTGLKHVAVPAGKLNVPPHCHSAEEEIFVVLEGGGALELTPSPDVASDGVEPSTHDVRPGSVVARPAGTGVAHAFRAGPEGLVLRS